MLPNGKNVTQALRPFFRVFFAMVKPTSRGNSSQKE